jgi:hypothetical protein
MEADPQVATAVIKCIVTKGGLACIKAIEQLKPCFTA